MRTMERYFLLGVLAIITLSPTIADAGVFELSGSFSFAKNRIDANNRSKRVSYRGAFGFHFTQVSGVELSYSMITTQYESSLNAGITVKDRIYSFRWVQSLVPRNTPVQPYIKVGVGQLNRNASGLISGKTDAVILDLAVGIRIFVSQQIAFNLEVNSYPEGGNISTWDENLLLSAGGSFYF